ncbi:hypothetical protein EES44_15260 [Streptomyces sp. ADI96-15]|nr:hypothetical protein EES44_15260 [Streptomyces sp. ADI96-15]
MERLQFDEVAELGAGAVRLHVPDAALADPGGGQRLAQDRFLGRSAGRGEEAGAAAGVVDGGAAHHGEHRVPVAFGVGEPLEDDDAAALAADVPVGRFVEGAAGALGREHAAPGEGACLVGRQDQVGGADHRRVHVSRPQVDGRLVQGDQGGGAGRVDGEARARPVEDVGQPVGDHGQGGTGGGVRVGVAGAAGHQLREVAGDGADEDTGAGPERVVIVAAALQGLGRDAEQEPLEGVGTARLAVGQAEAGRVEAFHSVEPPHAGLVGLRPEVGPAASVRRCLVDAGDAVEEVLPELVGGGGAGEAAGHADDGQGVPGGRTRAVPRPPGHLRGGGGRAIRLPRRARGRRDGDRLRPRGLGLGFGLGLGDLHGALGGEQPGQGGRCASGEDRRGADRRAQALTQAGGGEGDVGRVTAEVEEVGVRREVVGAQGGGEGGGDRPGESGQGRAVGRSAAGGGGRGGRRCLVRADDGVAGRLGQQGAGGLAVAGQRQRVEADVGVGDHVVGQRAARPRVELGPGRRLRADQVGGEAGFAASLEAGRGDHGGADAGEPLQHPFDLGGFDAVGAHLQLGVGPAEPFEGAVGVEPYLVPGAVQADAGGRVGEEGVRGEVGAVGVAAGEAGARDVQGSGRAGGAGCEFLVEDVQVHTGQGLAEGQEGADRGDAVAGGPDGRLGGPVEVPQGARGGVQRLGDADGQCLAAGEDGEAGRGPPAGLQQQPPHAGGRLGDGGLAGQLGEAARVAGGVAAGQDDGGALRRRQEQFQQGDVEGHRGVGEDPVLGGHGQTLADPGEEVGEGAVSDLDALGVAGRPAGEQDVGQVAGTHAGGYGQGRSVRLRDGQGRAERGAERVGARVREDQVGPRHLGVPAQPLGRVAGVQRQEGRTGPQHAEEGGQQVRPPLQEDAHDGAVLDTLVMEVGGDGVGPRVEGGVVEGAAAAADGHGLRPGGDGGGDQVEDGRAGRLGCRGLGAIGRCLLLGGRLGDRGGLGGGLRALLTVEEGGQGEVLDPLGEGQRLFAAHRGLPHEHRRGPGLDAEQRDLGVRFGGRLLAVLPFHHHDLGERGFVGAQRTSGEAQADLQVGGVPFPGRGLVQLAQQGSGAVGLVPDGEADGGEAVGALGPQPRRRRRPGEVEAGLAGALGDRAEEGAHDVGGLLAGGGEVRQFVAPVVGGGGGEVVGRQPGRPQRAETAAPPGLVGPQGVLGGGHGFQPFGRHAGHRGAFGDAEPLGGGLAAQRGAVDREKVAEDEVGVGRGQGDRGGGDGQGDGAGTHLVARQQPDLTGEDGALLGEECRQTERIGEGAVVQGLGEPYRLGGRGAGVDHSAGGRPVGPAVEAALPVAGVDRLGQGSGDDVRNEVAEEFDAGLGGLVRQGEGGGVVTDREPPFEQDAAGVHGLGHAVPGRGVPGGAFVQRPGGDVAAGVAGQRSVVEVDRGDPGQREHLGAQDAEVDHAEQVVEGLPGQRGGEVAVRVVEGDAVLCGEGGDSRVVAEDALDTDAGVQQLGGAAGEDPGAADQEAGGRHGHPSAVAGSAEWSGPAVSAATQASIWETTSSSRESWPGAHCGLERPRWVRSHISQSS